MGISATLTTATDEELRHFRSHPEALKPILTGLERRPACSLLEYWRRIHHLLTAGNPHAALPHCALERGDFSYSRAAETSHALLSSTTRALADLLMEHDQDRLRAYFEEERTRAEQAGRNAAPAVRWMATEKAVEHLTAETWVYLSTLRAFTSEAARQGMGLLVWKYEDW